MLKECVLKMDGNDRTMSDWAKKDKEELHQKSLERLKHWENTTAGHQRLKRQERALRLAAEEAQRVVLDEEFAAEEAELRSTAISKAKRMLYLEGDMVKSFHSHVNQLQAIEERDMQIALKHNRRHAFKKHDENIQNVTKKMMEETHQAQLVVEHEKLMQRFALAQDHLKQQHLKIMAKEAVRIEHVEEGKRIMQADKEYQQEQLAKQVQHKEASQKLNRSLEQMRHDVQIRRAEDLVKSKKHDEKIQAWVVRKENQSKLKIEMEKRWFL